MIFLIRVNVDKKKFKKIREIKFTKKQKLRDQVLKLSNIFTYK
jgi:hypothetical protein